MKNASDMLMLVRYMMKLYEKYLEDVQMKHRLSHIEIAIIGFLYNNPERDTAADIVERRMLPKGNVSAGVETLVQKGLLMRRQDQNRQEEKFIYLFWKKQFRLFRKSKKSIKNFADKFLKTFQ